MAVKSMVELRKVEPEQTFINAPETKDTRGTENKRSPCQQGDEPKTKAFVGACLVVTCS
jgi:hypothetical protein